MHRDIPLLLLAVALPLGAQACKGCGEGSNFGNYRPGDGDSASDTAIEDSNPPIETGDSSSEEEAAFDNPGDIVAYDDETGKAEINLADLSGDSNRGQEFFLVLVNSSDDDLGYTLRYLEGESDTGTSRRSAPPPQRNRAAAHPLKKLSAARTKLREAVRAGRVGPATAAHPLPPPFDEDDVGDARSAFRVRNSVDDEESYDLIDSVLWATGESVNIWVDADVPIDWDTDCDGTIDVVDPRGAYGFDNCDLGDIADIVDTNIYPNLTQTFGEVSDVNEDGKVSVVITSVLNRMTGVAEEEEDRAKLVGSYADPEVDLNDWDSDENPGSDEQEVIYVFAPDPYGFYNVSNRATVSEYTSVELAAQIARALTRLIIYNQHNLERSSEQEEETWLVEGLGALAADLTGFGAVYFDDVWDYLDAPHLSPLVTTEDVGAVSTASWGPQYLFLRWLVDTQGTGFLWDLVNTSGYGTSNVETATGFPFETLVVTWQVALLTTGVTNAEGDPMVSSEDYPAYSDAVTLAEGDYFGANGYQQGINLRGTNIYAEGGTSSEPTENEDKTVVVSNTDHLTHVTGFPFFGYVSGYYGAQVVRLTDITFDEAVLEIQSASNNYTGVVVRWNDSLAKDYAVENSASALDANNIALPTLEPNGEPVYAIGNLMESGRTLIVTEEDEALAAVYDTDRWLLDLTDWSDAGHHTVSVQLDRHYEDEDGNIAPFDPWLAVVPIDSVPAPTVSDLARSACPDDDALDFNFPYSVLDYQFYQVFLATDPFTEEDAAQGDTGDTGAGSTSNFDACGVSSGQTLTCGEDFDQDGVYDAEEPQPQSFIQQLQVVQCTSAGGDASAFTPLGAEIFDWDEIDDDDDPYYARARNLGGKTGESGEEAYIEIDLLGGEQYLIVVGASSDTGVYELTIKKVD